MDILEQDNSAHYVEAMKKLKTWTARKGERREENIFFSMTTLGGTIREFRWTVLPHPPHSPALAPSDFHP